MSIIVQIDDSTTRATLKALASPDTLHTVLEAVGEEVRTAAIDHFRAREEEPENTSGFPKFGQSFGKRGFWAGTHDASVAEAVQAPVFLPGDNSVLIDIDSPKLAHKADPNPPPIVPTGGRKYLAIPANARAAAWQGMPRDLDGNMKLAYAPTPDGHKLPALVLKQSGTSGTGTPQYWLVRSVQTRTDPRAMPDPAILTTRANARAATTLDLLLRSP